MIHKKFLQVFGGLGGRMGYATAYFWVVLCKNRRFHRQGNTSYAHQIAFGETDAYSSLPPLSDQLNVRCDRCGVEYRYRTSEVLRNEIAVPDDFVPHPLFR